MAKSWNGGEPAASFEPGAVTMYPAKKVGRARPAPG